MAVARTEVSLVPKANVFSAEFSALASIFLLTDNKLVYGNCIMSADMKVCVAAQATVRPTIPHDHGFGEPSFVGRPSNGRFISIQASI
jgi:hypothetical protein